MENIILAKGEKIAGTDVVIIEAADRFTHVRKAIFDRAHAKAPDCGVTKSISQSSDVPELLGIIRDNIRWCVNEYPDSAAFLEAHFTKEELHSQHIYTSGKHHIIVADKKIATIVALGSSSATVETLGSSSATVKTWDSSSATVKTLGSSSATVETWDSRSKLTYTLGEGRCPTIKHLTEKKLYVRTSEFEVVQLS